MHNKKTRAPDVHRCSRCYQKKSSSRPAPFWGGSLSNSVAWLCSGLVQHMCGFCGGFGVGHCECCLAIDQDWELVRQSRHKQWSWPLGLCCGLLLHSLQGVVMVGILLGIEVYYLHAGSSKTVRKEIGALGLEELGALLSPTMANITHMQDHVCTGLSPVVPFPCVSWFQLSLGVGMQWFLAYHGWCCWDGFCPPPLEVAVWLGSGLSGGWWMPCPLNTVPTDEQWLAVWSRWSAPSAWLC